MTNTNGNKSLYINTKANKIAPPKYIGSNKTKFSYINQFRKIRMRNILSFKGILNVYVNLFSNCTTEIKILLFLITLF